MSKSSITDELFCLHELLEKGAITLEEYEEQKARLFNQARNEEPNAEVPKEINTNADNSSDVTNKIPQIIINQSTTAAASSTATAIAKAKNGGCLKTILAAIGFFVVLSAILATCSTDDSEKENTTDNKSGNVSILAEAASTMQPTQAQLQEKLEVVKRDNIVADNNINAVWNDMDSDVRDFLKSEQFEWNRNKIVQCKTSNYDTSEENQITYVSCLTDLTTERATQLREKQAELLPRVKEAKLQKVKLEAQSSIDTLKETWNSLQEPIRDQLNDDFNKWSYDVDKQCGSDSSADTQIQMDINRYICTTKLVKIKTKELNGYKI